MQRTLTNPPKSVSTVEAEPVFNVVIAYEDFETGKHAKVTFDFLVNTLGHDCRFSNQMWKFDILGIPKLREMALKDALQADIMIVSSRGGEELPEHVREWLEAGLEQGRTVMALVALFNCQREALRTARPVRNYLAGLARRAGIEFFAQPEERPGERAFAEFPPEDNQEDRNQRTIATLAGYVQRDTVWPRWGINE